MPMEQPDENLFQSREGEPLFIAIPRHDPQIEEATNRARATLAKFIARFSEADTETTYSAKIRFLDPDHSKTVGEDRYIFLWVDVVEIEGESFSGLIFEVPASVHWLSKGQKVTFKTADVYDWMILQQGHLFGGYTLRVVREKMPEAQRRNYDIYLRVSVYENLET